MPKFKKIHFEIQGIKTEFDIHINKEGKFFVNNTPKEILTTLNIQGFESHTFIDLQQAIKLAVIEYHEALMRIRKVIIYRTIIGNSCFDDLKSNGINNPSRFSGNIGSSIYGYGYQFDWEVALESNVGGKKTYRRYMGDQKDCIDIPFEKLPLIGYIFPDQIVVDYSVDLELFFIELKKATVNLTSKIALMFGENHQALLDNINQKRLLL
jgi:hypothetical protein